jgi:hypothetical protein
MSRTARLVLAVLAGLAGVSVSWFLAQHSLVGARGGFLLLVAVWVPLWLVAAWAAGGVGTRVSLTAVMAIAILLRLAAAAGSTPSISNDLYRYAWDAHVQLAGVDPYRNPPGAAASVRLRTPEFWPAARQCRHLRMAPGCALLNRPQDRTIYPPVAEAWFLSVRVLTFGAGGARPWQLAGGLADDVTIVLIAFGLQSAGRDPRAVAWYALSPLPVIEFAGNGHVDGLALLLMVAAVLALRRNRPGWAGTLIGLATMVKLYPALAVAGWWRRGRWRLAGFAAAVVVVTEAPHLLAVGGRVLGYLPGYLAEEHYTGGARFLLVGLLGLNGPLSTAMAGAILVASVFVVARRDLEPAVALAAVLATLILVTTPVQPWYAATVGGAGVLAGAPWLMVLGLAAEPYYAAVILAQRHQVAAGRIGYAVALGIIVLPIIRSSPPLRPSPLPVGTAAR